MQTYQGLARRPFKDLGGCRIPRVELDEPGAVLVNDQVDPEQADEGIVSCQQPQLGILEF